MKYFIILISTFIFTGCWSTIEYITITKYKYYPIPKEYMTTDINLSVLPNRNDYINAMPLERERMQDIAIIKLYKIIGTYKVKLKSIKKYDDNISRLIKEKNTIQD